MLFPSFVWISGVSYTLSHRSLQRQLDANPRESWSIKARHVTQALRRSVVLFLLGLFLASGSFASGVEFDKLRIPGVLQYFAFCNLYVGGILILLSTPSQVSGWYGPRLLCCRPLVLGPHERTEET